MNDPREFALRSYRGHMGRLKSIGRDHPDIMQHVLGIEHSVSQLIASNDGNDSGASGHLPVRNPAHFKANGRNLSPEGQAFIFRLYDEGFSIRGAAARIGISLKSAADYRSAWLRRGPEEVS